MKTLLTLFSEKRSELQTEIDRASNLEQVVKLVQSHLVGLERTYIDKLSVAQVRLASFFLETLRQSINSLSAIARANSDSTARQIVTQGIPPQNLILKLLEGLICIGILGALFSMSQNNPGAWMAILLIFLLVGLEVVLQLNKRNQENRLDPEIGEASQPIGVVDSQLLLDNLADALNTIDLAVGSAFEVKQTSDSNGIEELPELLNFVQRLIGASFLDRAQMTLELAKMLPQILMEQGVRTEIYRIDSEQSHRAYFDFEPSIDNSLKDYITITPALWKGDRLLRRGRVIEPAKVISG